MCGIVGYTGSREGPGVVISGLRRLEYRGYDSAGVASMHRTDAGRINLSVKRAEGRLENLVRLLSTEPVVGHASIGHTRWATHGKPSERNAHPHRFKEVVIVHNGIIENYAELITDLKRRGHEFSSETDSEVIAHLIQSALEKTDDLLKATLETVRKLKGAFAFAAMSTRSASTMCVAKQQCPMVIGLGEGEQFVASDIPALLEFTRDFVFLNDGEVASIEPEGVKVMNFTGKILKKKVRHIEWSLATAEKEGFPHFMLKEIHEQPRVLRDTLRGRLSARLDDVIFDQVKVTPSEWRSFDAVNLLACGTAWHACLIGKYWIEKFAGIRADVELASEFRYREPVLSKKALVVAVSQSGETADTLAATTDALKRKVKGLAITNTVESSLVRRTKNVIYTHAGPEIAVASTKCFLAQLEVLYLLAVKLALVSKKRSTPWAKRVLKNMVELPEALEIVLQQNDIIRSVAERYSQFNQYFYLGRGFSYPVALEGALKLKEIAYVNTQAYPAGEMKHGPIALIDSSWPVIGLAPNDSLRDKTISNLEEVKARGGNLLIVGTQGDEKLKALAQEWIEIPKVSEELTPFLTTVVLQLYAYHMSAIKGCDVDKPKNLAKSVTVE